MQLKLNPKLFNLNFVKVNVKTLKKFFLTFICRFLFHILKIIKLNLEDKKTLENKLIQFSHYL